MLVGGLLPCRHQSQDLSATKSNDTSQLIAGNFDETLIWMQAKYATSSASGR